MNVKHSQGCVTNSILFSNNMELKCYSSTNKTLYLPGANGRDGQFLVIIDDHMKWIDPPNPDIIRLSASADIKADQLNCLIEISYEAKHDNPHPICTLQGEGDLQRIINYHLVNISTSDVKIIVNTNANLINTKFNRLSGIYRNMKAINSSNGMLIIVYINQDGRVILNKCMTEDGDGYFVCNETDIIVPINALDIYPLHEKKLGIVHNDGDYNVIFTSCNLPDGNGIKTNVVIDNCPVSVIKLVSTRTEVIVISYIASDGYLYYGYLTDSFNISNPNGWTIKMLPTDVKIVGGYLDMITFNGQSIAMLYYTINKELMLVYTTDTIDNGSWNFKLIGPVDDYRSIQLTHLENNEFIVLYGNKVYYHNKSTSFDLIKGTATLITSEGNQFTILGIDINNHLYSYTYNYIEDLILNQGQISNIDNIVETQLLYTSTGALINSYLTDQTPGVVVSPFPDRFAYDVSVNINCLIK